MKRGLQVVGLAIIAASIATSMGLLEPRDIQRQILVGVEIILGIQLYWIGTKA